MIEIDVIRGEVLGVDVIRGFALLSDLSRISRADVFDEKLNPMGTQRDLSPKHAKDAYEYARNSARGYWPEVFLCLRDANAISYVPSGDHSGKLIIDDKMIESGDHIMISRVDGNHRLHFADGKVEGTPALDINVSFCIAMGLTLIEEISLFRDINNNQKRMDTSHLDKIDLRISGEDVVKSRNPSLYIANSLANDEHGPLSKFIYQGGKRPPGTFIPLRALNTGIEYMLSRQSKLTAIGSVDAQVALIRNYFSALKIWVPDAWKSPKEYLLLRGAGLWGSCFLGAEVIDRALTKQKFETSDMLDILKSGKNWDWSRNGDFQGFSGRGGAVKVADKIIRELKNEEGVSMKDLLSKILENK